MDFIKLSLRLSIIVLALFSTYASVLGLGSLFISTAIPVMIAGAALELGKYSALTLVYTNWENFNKKFKVLVVSFITVLMVFTSAGVFSYLGKSYQETFKQVALINETTYPKVTQLEEINKSLQNIESQIANLPSNSVNGRIKLLEAYKAEKDILLSKKVELEKSIESNKALLLEANLHAGPISYLSSILDSSIEKTSTIVILLLTLCLDPFAILLTLLYNKIYSKKLAERKDIVQYSDSLVCTKCNQEVDINTLDESVHEYEYKAESTTIDRNAQYYSPISPQLYKDIAEGKQMPLDKHTHKGEVND